MMTRDEMRWIQLMEEAAEVQQSVSKLLRFGLNEIESGQQLTNIERVRIEVGDFFAALQELEDCGNMNPWNEADLAAHIVAKRAKVAKFLKYSEALSRVEPTAKTGAGSTTPRGAP